MVKLWWLRSVISWGDYFQKNPYACLRLGQLNMKIRFIKQRQLQAEGYFCVKSLLNFFVVLLSLFIINKSHADCNFVTVTNVNFGSYDVLSGLNNDSTGSVSVTCTTFDFVTISIGPSPNSGGFNPRQMKLTTGTDLLNYNLYTNSSRSTIWGDGTQGTSVVYVIVLSGRTVTRTIYGRIPPGQDVGIGNYGEALVITISY